VMTERNGALFFGGNAKKVRSVVMLLM
jgi:hypothetical protein